ncbi:MAG: segregation protein B [Acidobacteriia bacterium]|nr:segregation protein B [Terriglobia bacterium]
MNRAHQTGRSENGIYRVAIVGAGTLKGKELAEVLPETSFPAVDIKLLDDDESLGQLEAVGEEVTFVQSVRPENFANVDFTFFTSQPEFTRKHWRIAQQAGSMIVDLSYGLEDVPGARIRSPWVERELRQAQIPELEPAPVVAAHPAAVALTLLIARAQKVASLRSAVATIFEPASEHGRAGMDELHEQTVNLLSFQELPKQVFDAQVAFNLLPRYGEHSSPTLDSAERRILSHYRAITANVLPVPSVMLVQAPIFHGHVFSLYIELEQAHSIGDLSQAIAGEHVELTRVSEESPSNVAAAGQEEVLVWVRADAQRETGFWIWAAADNLRVLALNAIDVAQQMAAAMPKGKLQ